MDLFEILLIAVGLSMDAFAVALGAAASGRASDGRAAFRLAFHFGLFQFLMPVLGWFVGLAVAPIVASFDHWVAFGLLAVVGVKMIRAGAGPDGETSRADPTRGWTLVMLSVATSIDALAVGLSLAMLADRVWQPAVVIGVVTGTLTLLGVGLGHRVGGWVGRRMETVGGVILIAVGLRIVYQHVMA
jgi:manganese efflux pump family protein